MITVPKPNVPGILKTVSPSSIKTFKQCPRKWWLEKRCGLSDGEKDHLIVGTAFHAAMEMYFDGPTRGKLVDPHAYAWEKFPNHPVRRQMLETVVKSGRLMLQDPDAPRPEEGLLSEVPRDYNTGLVLCNTSKFEGVRLRQRSDLLDPRRKDLLFSFDFKTAKTVFGDYTLTGEELAHDPQCVLYLWEAFEKFKPDAARFAHLTCSTSEVEANVIPTDDFSYEQIMERVAAIEEIVARMIEVFAIDNFHEVPCGKGAPSASYGSPCRSFGGCFAAPICGVELPAKKTPADVSPPPPPKDPSMPKLSLKERLAAAAAAGQLATGINPPDAAKPAPVTPFQPLVLKEDAVTATPAPVSGTTTSTAPKAADIIKRIEAGLAELRGLLS